MTLHVFEVVIDTIDVTFSGRVLRIDRLNVSAGTNVPLTGWWDSGIVGCLGVLAVWGVEALAGV
jgi:hypothetical protein